MKSFSLALLLIACCISFVFGVTISDDTINKSIDIVKSELENNISNLCPEIPESIYQKAATDIILGNEINIENELAVAIRNHYLNETEIELSKRGDLLSREACMKLCEAGAFVEAGFLCASFFGCLFAPVAGFATLATCYNGC